MKGLSRGKAPAGNSQHVFRQNKNKGSDTTDNIDFREIVETHGNMVYRIALSHTLDKSSAEDIFQDVFLSLVKKFKKLENGDHLKHWLIRTSINRSISYNRKIHRQAEIPESANKFCSDDTAFQDLKSVIEALPEKYRIVIFLCCYEGYTTRETAKILNKSEGTIKSQLFRAKKLLKKELEE